MKEKSFKRWLLEQLDRQDRTGEVSRLVADVLPGFGGDDFQSVMVALLTLNAGGDTLLALEEARREYERERFLNSVKKDG